MTMILRNFGHWIPMWLIASLVIGLVMAAFFVVQHRKQGVPWGRLILTWLLVCWGLGTVVVTLLPTAWGEIYDGSTGLNARTLDLAPFASDTSSAAFVQQPSVSEIVGNVLMFAVGGFLVSARFKLGVWRTAGTGLAVGLLIEALQYVLGTGRVSSTSDVIWAGIGMLAGAVIAVWITHRRTSVASDLVASK